ncbi:MAG: hypothetical protein ACYC41_13850, partial [Bacillota bacterium]
AGAAGVDVIPIDTWTLQYDVTNPPFDGDFSEYSLRGFRDYLSRKYSAAELRGFGVADVSSFDYGDFIRRGYRALYDSNRLAVPLFPDFLDFQMQSSLDFWGGLIKEVKAYAAAKGKTVSFMVNVPEWDNAGHRGTIHGLPLIDVVDGFMSEFPYGIPPERKTVPIHKLYAAVGKPAILESASGFSYVLYQRPDPTQLMKLYVVEAYASGGFIHAPYGDLLATPDGWKMYSADMDQLYPYYDFIHENRVVYEGLTSTARIGVLYSYATMKNDERLSESFFGLANLLLDAHHQYDTVLAGDGRWVADKLTLDQLNRYEVVILPDTSSLSDRQVELLLTYVEGGGSVVSFGDVGVRDEDGQPRERRELKDLLGGGTRRYGLGRFVHVTGDPGSTYLKGRDAATRQAVDGALRQLLTEDVQTSADDKVALLSYWSAEAGSEIIHLINYDYDSAQQRYNPRDDVEISVRTGGRLWGKALGVYYLSPDDGTARDLAFTTSGDTISFRVPRLETYGVVAVGEKGRFEAARQIGILKGLVEPAGDGSVAGGAGSRVAAAEVQVVAAEAAYAKGDYAGAARIATSAAAELQRPEAEALLSEARAVVDWWEPLGRTYRLEDAKSKLKEASDAYASGDFRRASSLSAGVPTALRFAVDGGLDDWQGLKPLGGLTTVGAPAAAGKPRIDGLWMTNDREYLYLAVRLTGAEAEPNLDLDFSVDGKTGRIYANNYGAQVSFAGAQTELSKAVIDGLFELKIPLSVIGNKGRVEFTASCSSGAPNLPLSSRVAGDKVSGSYVMVEPR